MGFLPDESVIHLGHVTLSTPHIIAAVTGFG